MRVGVLQSTRRCLAVLQSTPFFRRCLAELLFVRRLFMEGSLANVDRGNCLVSRGSLQDSMGRGRLLTCWECRGPSSGSSVSGKTTAITNTIITSITITVSHQLLTHLLTYSLSFFLFIIITIVTAIEQLDPRGGLRALERRRACDGVFVMGTCEQ